MKVPTLAQYNAATKKRLLARVSKWFDDALAQSARSYGGTVVSELTLSAWANSPKTEPKPEAPYEAVGIKVRSGPEEL